MEQFKSLFDQVWIHEQERVVLEFEISKNTEDMMEKKTSLNPRETQWALLCIPIN